MSSSYVLTTIASTEDVTVNGLHCRVAEEEELTVTYRKKQGNFREQLMLGSKSKQLGWGSEGRELISTSHFLLLILDEWLKRSF